MSKKLDELMLLIRQHEGFKELLSAVEAPSVKPYRLSDGKKQYEEWIFRSGRAQQNELWQAFLTDQTE